ncbi:MAG: septum formation initiator family protein [candidate division Zixibacteria bacterium]|nr:septum formation initiator family protein [candidate division Zixibacteria bacterium]
MFKPARKESSFVSRIRDRALGSKKSFRLFLWLAGSIVLLYLFATGNFGFLRILSLYEKRENLIRENRYLTVVQADLEWRKRELAKNPVLVEKLAREKMGLTKKGEILYKIIPPKDSTPKFEEGAYAPLQN